MYGAAEGAAEGAGGGAAEGAAENAAPTPEGAAYSFATTHYHPSIVAEKSTSPAGESQGWLSAMHYVNIVNSLLLAMTAFIIILTVFKGQLAEAFIAVYILLFSCMLLAFELRLSSYEDQLRNDFGFLFTSNGRGGFLFLIGLLNFGVPGFEIGRGVGLFTLVNTFFNLFVLSQNASWRTTPVKGRSLSGASPGGKRTHPLVTALHWANILNAVLLGSATSLALPVIVRNHGILSDFFITLYLLIFACMLLAFELRMSQYEDILLQQYGFMFDYKGRGMFVLFVGALCFAIQKFPFGHLVGCVTMVNALFNIYVLNANPELREVERDEGYEPVAESGFSYQQENPDVQDQPSINQDAVDNYRQSVVSNYSPGLIDAEGDNESV